MDAEVERTAEKHLVIAENLSLSLSRYINDVARVFAHAASEVSNDNRSDTRDIHLRLLQSLNVEAMVILPSFAEDSPQEIIMGEMLPRPAQEVLDQLRASRNPTLNGVNVSPLQRIGDEKFFILGYELPDGRLAVGYLSTDYVKSVQRAIAFGQFGHSAIFDNLGRAVAHPSPQVEENMMDASGISAVRRMLDRETGVETFYSPPMDTDMIAGITYVPETGWPVMVPQPLYELSDAVNASLAKSYALVVAIAGLLGLFGWMVSRRLSRPVERFTKISGQISTGDYNVSLPLREDSSKEMSELNESLKLMVEKVRESEQKLKEALRIEEAENKRKSEFMIIAGHELRTPLAGVIGMLTICDEQNEDPELQKFLNIAKQSSSELNHLVDNMVAFAEGQNDILKLRPREFDIGEFFENIEVRYAQLANQAGLSFRREGLGDERKIIISDPDRLSQVLTKILDNAIKFTEVGEVKLFSEVEETSDGSWLHMQVMDTGVGIPDDSINRVFMPFEQIDASFTRSYRGMGIGLSVAGTIVSAFEGEINCQSEPGRGTQFDIWIPIKNVADDD